MNLNEEEMGILYQKIASLVNYSELLKLGYEFDKDSYIRLCVSQDSSSYSEDCFELIENFLAPTLGFGSISLNVDIEDDILGYELKVPYDINEYEYSGDKITDGFTLIINSGVSFKCKEYGIFDDNMVFSFITDSYFLSCDFSDEFKQVQVKYIDNIGLIIVISSIYYLDPILFVEEYIGFLTLLEEKIKDYEENQLLQLA